MSFHWEHGFPGMNNTKVNFTFNSMPYRSTGYPRGGEDMDVPSPAGTDWGWWQATDRRRWAHHFSSRSPPEKPRYTLSGPRGHQWAPAVSSIHVNWIYLVILGSPAGAARACCLKVTEYLYQESVGFHGHAHTKILQESFQIIPLEATRSYNSKIELVHEIQNTTILQSETILFRYENLLIKYHFLES